MVAKRKSLPFLDFQLSCIDLTTSLPRRRHRTSESDTPPRQLPGLRHGQIWSPSDDSDMTSSGATSVNMIHAGCSALGPVRYEVNEDAQPPPCAGAGDDGGGRSEVPRTARFVSPGTPAPSRSRSARCRVSQCRCARGRPSPGLAALRVRVPWPRLRGPARGSARGWVPPGRRGR